MTQNTPITVAYGDGIGPEIMEATLHIIVEAGARIDDPGARCASERRASEDRRRDRRAVLRFVV